MGIFSAHWGFRLLWGIGFLLKWEHQKPALHVVNHHKPSTNPLWCQILDDFGWFAGCQPTHSVVEAHWASKKGLSATTSRTLARPVFQDVSWLFCNDIEYIYMYYIIYIYVYIVSWSGQARNIFFIFWTCLLEVPFYGRSFFGSRFSQNWRKPRTFAAFIRRRGVERAIAPAGSFVWKLAVKKHTHIHIYI